MPELIKTKTGKKLHIAGSGRAYGSGRAWCGIRLKPTDSDVTGFVRYADVCDRCAGSVALNTIDVDNVIFRNEW